jgi:hypothetical protein
MTDNPRSLHAPAALCLTLVLALGLAACSGGSGGSSSPTDPGAGGPSASLSTQWGELVFQTQGHAVDFDRALQSVTEGYDKARAQIGARADGLRLDGYRVTVMPASWELNGQHLRSTREIRMRAGVENVLEHELQHLFAWELDRHNDCKTYQDHPGGFDLSCRKLL